MARNRVLMDTNILLYAATADARSSQHAAEKIQRSLDLVMRHDLLISAQNILEFSANARKAKGAGLSHGETLEWIDLLLEYPFMPNTRPLVVIAVDFAFRYKINTFDAAMMAAGNAGRVDLVYSEDLNHGQTYGSVRVCNPFIEDFLA